MATPKVLHKVFTASGQPLAVTGHGSIVFAIQNDKTDREHDLTFTDVLHVPDLEENILSVCSLDRKGIHLTAGKEKMILRHKGNFVAVAPLCTETSQYHLSYQNTF